MDDRHQVLDHLELLLIKSAHRTTVNHTEMLEKIKAKALEPIFACYNKMRNLPRAS